MRRIRPKFVANEALSVDSVSIGPESAACLAGMGPQSTALGLRNNDDEIFDLHRRIGGRDGA
jgi:hypothetical protein